MGEGKPSFDEIRAKAEADLRGLRDNDKPLLMVGTATCGLAQGAGDVVSALREGAKQLKLHVDVLGVGCLGHCYAEPLVVLKMRAR